MPTGNLVNPVFDPLADLYPSQSGPVPEGTVNGYGTATWIPTGYPIATQPYLTTDGRCILRPLRYNQSATGSALNTVTAYVAAALQYAVTKYAAVPYNVMAQTRLWSGPAVLQSYWIAPPTDHFALLTRLTMGSIDPDWLNPNWPQSTWADSAFLSGKNLVMSTFTTGANAIVPGLGTQLTNAIDKASGGSLYGDYASTPAAQQQVQATNNLFGQLLGQANGILGAQGDNLFLYAVVAIALILIILAL